MKVDLQTMLLTSLSGQFSNFGSGSTCFPLLIESSDAGVFKLWCMEAIGLVKAGSDTVELSLMDSLPIEIVLNNWM